MGTVVNLNRYRKTKQADERKRRADERRMRFGMTKEERAKKAAEQSLDARRHDGHRFVERGGGDCSND